MKNKYFPDEEIQTNEIHYINAVVLMGLFTFLFLGAEYLYVDVLSGIVSENRTVLAQNYALGVSTVGFLLYPIFNRICKGRMKSISYLLIGGIAALCMSFICIRTEFTAVFLSGLVLFLIFGLIGSGVFYISIRILKTDRCLARTVGIAYAVGILLQFINNNLIRSKSAEVIILSVFLILLIWRVIENESECCKKEQQEERNFGTEEIKKGHTVGILLIILIALMTCIFSTLDNAVTLVHSAGNANIGQAPRILLALSGLAAGFIFDIKNRKYMGIIMYCVMVLSTICIAVMEFSGPFLVGLIVFYLSAGFFAVFFTTGFMEISRYMKVPELWAGMGRAVNNMIAALIANSVLGLMSDGSGLVIVILVLLVFVAVSIISVLYTFQKNAFMEQLIVNEENEVSEEERLQKIAETFSFTEREREVFTYLINTEDNVQTIADNLYVSRRTLERYISAIYKKTGTKSRVGLFNLYNK